MRIDKNDQLRIHMCDDDPDDRLLIEEALIEARLSNEIDFTKNGKDLLDCLNHTGDYADIPTAPLPNLILLDLNMPQMDGREVLKKVKSNPRLNSIPIIVLTTSTDIQDISKAYALGASSFIVKPNTFETLVEVIKAVTCYWFKVVTLPIPPVPSKVASI